MTTKFALQIALAVIGAGFSGFLLRAFRGHQGSARPTAFHVAVGALTDFLDTLGIGSFATTTTLYRLARRVDDRTIPGTLNIGHTLPTIVQALLYIAFVDVAPATLVGLIAASVLGAWLGAARVAAWPRRTVRTVMGVSLLAAAVLMTASAASLLPKGGDALGLSPAKLAVGVACNFVLGALMTTGIGLYAPCMVLVSALGMNPAAAFPIMMGSCAFLMPAASVRFVERGAWDPKATLGLVVGGIPGVLVATYLVRSLPLGALRILVAVVVLYTGVTLLSAARTAETTKP